MLKIYKYIQGVYETRWNQNGCKEHEEISLQGIGPRCQTNPKGIEPYARANPNWGIHNGTVSHQEKNKESDHTLTPVGLNMASNHKVALFMLNI